MAGALIHKHRVFSSPEAFHEDMFAIERACCRRRCPERYTRSWLDAEQKEDS